MQLELIKGVVSDVRYSNGVSGGMDTTDQSNAAIFKLANTPVSLSLSAPVMIDEGNIVSLAGHRKRGIFYPRAYKNETLKVWGSKPGWSQILFGIPFIFFAGIGIYIIWDAVRNLKARRELNL